MKTSQYKRSWFPAGTLLILSVTMPLCAQPLFHSGALTPAGVSPHSVVVRDFNGDGWPDLATANVDSNDVTVLLGTAAGGFTAAAGSPFIVGTKPQSLAVGDFNGDGKPDLAIANSGSNTVTILLGDGAGGFTQASGSPFTAGTNPQSVAVGDFNGDDQPDLAIANSGGNNVTVLLGNGTGGFASSSGSPFKAGTNPQSVAVGDFNGDGKPDLAIANAGSNTVTVLLGTGAGAFKEATGSPFKAGTNPQSVAVGDFNGDGKPDLAIANAGSNTITVLLGTGAGGFTAATRNPFATETNPQSVAVGDLNGDGRLDLAVTNQGSNTVTVLLGDGAGGFGAALGSPFAMGLNPVSVAVGDFNRDGKLDLAAALSGDSSVAILQNATPVYSSVFRDAAGSPFPTPDFCNAISTLVGDFNKDGKRDVAMACSATNSVMVMLGNGTGGFTEAPGSPFAVGQGALSIVMGDFNRDGTLDLATANAVDNTVTVLLGNGAGGFKEAPGSPLGVGLYPLSLAVGDFNGDGKLDLATADEGANTATVLLGDGTGGFAAAPGGPFPAGNQTSVVAGDFNGDGKTDFVVVAVDLRVFLSNGAGGFAPGKTVSLNIGAYSAAVGDFNGDGKLDIVTADYQTDNVTVLLGDGMGGFTVAPGSPFYVTTGADSLAVGDFNGDGKLDLVTCNSLNSTSMTVLLGDGAGGLALAPGSPFSEVGLNPLSLAVGDFNGDGRADLMIGGTNVLSARLNTTLQSITVSPVSASVAAGRTQQVTATGRYADNSTQDLTAFVTWSSSNTGIASIGNSVGTQGIVTGVSVGGPVTMTAALAGLSATASLKVTPAPTLQSITVAPATASLLPGATQQFTATGRYSDGSTLDLTASVTWSSSNTQIASIGNSAGTLGVATGLLGGSVTIKATLNGIAGTAALTVPALLSITVSPSAGSIASGLAQPFTATGRYADNSTQVLTAAVTWSSSSAAIASVSNSAVTHGIATGLSIGSATIGATLNGITGTASLTVTAATLQSITVSPALISIAKGTTQQFTATGRYSNNSTQNLSASVNWSSSNPLIASVSNSAGTQGKATGVLGGGPVMITATLTGASVISGSGSVSVTATAYSSVFRDAAGSPFPTPDFCNAISTLVGDFNKDGKRDVAMACSGTNSVMVMLGNGTGGFTEAPGSPFAVGQGALSIVMGDFNRDGTLDLATANAVDNTVTVLLGNGAGGFKEAPGSPLGVGLYPLSLTVGDFNGDGKLDLATADESSYTATVLLGDGTGGFAAAPGSPFSAGNPASAVVAGDFNGDGKTDFVVVAVDLRVFLSNGAGGFAPGKTVSLNIGVNSAAVGDFNGDGKLDIVTADYQTDNVTVLLGDGAGGFTVAPGSPFHVTTGADSLAVGDFNGDGKLDLVTCNSGNSTSITVLLGDGAGGLALAPGSPFSEVGLNPQSLAVGDFNGDGRADLMIGGANVLGARLNTPLQSLAVSPATASVAAGRTQQFTATGRYADNSTQDLTAFVTWSSSNTGIASIGNSVGTQGIVTGVSVGGPVTMTAALAGLSVTASLKVTPAPPLQSITVSPATASLLQGATQQFTATGRYSDNYTQDLTASVTWSSSNTQIASIGNSAGTFGVATGLAPGGPVTITATLNGAAAISASATVSVSSPKPNIWGLSAAAQIYRLNDSWTLIPSPSGKTPAEVSAAADGTVWVLDSNGNIYSWTGSSWQTMPGTLQQVSVGAVNDVWGVNSTNTIYRWNGSSWATIPGPANHTPKDVSAASDGTVWSLDTAGNIYSYSGSGWQMIPGALVQVSAGSSNNVWGLNSTGAIYQWNGSSWSSIPIPANSIPKQVSVGHDGTVYLIDSLGNIYVRSGSAWQQLSGQLVQISAG